jgi:hypothetical protein
VAARPLRSARRPVVCGTLHERDRKPEGFNDLRSRRDGAGAADHWRDTDEHVLHLVQRDAAVCGQPTVHEVRRGGCVAPMLLALAGGFIVLNGISALAIPLS